MASFELELIDWLRPRHRAHSSVELGIGDDMAIVTHPSGVVLVTSDLILDGVHFDTSRHDYDLIGRKAIACSLSDCAAMAVRPTAATVSLALPKGLSMDDVKTLYQGMEEIAAKYDLAIVGGDTTRWASPLAIDVTMLAEPYENVRPIRRDGARVGDCLYVTGSLGGSILGRHLQFTPRVKESRSIALHLGPQLHAMIDISDGLALDLRRLCDASGVGAELNEELLESIISNDARLRAKETSRTPLEHAMEDGEDYELLLAVEGAANIPGIQLHEIGSVTVAGHTLRRLDGTSVPLEPRGYVH